MQEIILKNNISEHFTLISYPDGQYSIKLNMDKLSIKESISIKCRIRNFGELEVLLCLLTALKKYDFNIYLINFVYLFGMRSDRAFEIGEPNYFRDVVNPILKLLKCNMTFLSPHNLNSVREYYFESNNFVSYPNYCVLGGDFSFYKEHKYMLDGYFEKQRKERIVVDLKHINNSKEKISEYEGFIIMDDLCDGGATFIAEGEYLKKHFPNKNLVLYVEHGLFTQGVYPLLSYFDEIICTNSYQDIDHPRVKQIKVI